MKKKQKPQQLLEELKSKVEGLSMGEKEKFRDNLLAYLLFGDQPCTEPLPDKEILKGISENERSLIRKLAAQTEELYKAMMKNNDDKNIQ